MTMARAGLLRNGSVVRFLSQNAGGRPLAIEPNGDVSCSAERADEATNWRVHTSSDHYRFQSVLMPHNWLRVNRKGQTEARGEGASLCEFHIVRTPFRTPAGLVGELFWHLFRSIAGPARLQLEVAPGIVCLRSKGRNFGVGVEDDGSVVPAGAVAQGRRARFAVILASTGQTMITQASATPTGPGRFSMVQPAQPVQTVRSGVADDTSVCPKARPMTIVVGL
jgi:hypothetical protein